MAPTINLGRRARLAIKIGGFAVLGLLSFVFALQLTFDYDRVAKKFFVEALASSHEVTIGEVKRGIMPGTFTMKRVKIQARQTKADEVQPVMIFDEIDADVGVFALIGGAISVDFEATIGGGTLTGSVSFPMKGGGFSVSASGHGIKGDAIPQLRDAISLPLLGKLDLGLSASLSGNDWRKATGYLTLGCPKGCTLGDGQTKFKPRVKNQRSATMMGEGIEWGRVEIDRFAARADLKGGKIEVTKWEFESRDAELHVDLSIKLAKRFKDSEFTVGCFRYKATPALTAREAKTAAAISTVGGILGPDGLFHIKLEGTYATVKARGKRCDQEGDEPNVAGGGGSRIGLPTLSATTADGVKPVDTGGAQPGADINPQPVIDAAPPDAEAAGSGSAGSGSAAVPPGATPAGLVPAGVAPPSAEVTPTPTPEPPPEPPPPVAPKENE